MPVSGRGGAGGLLGIATGGGRVLIVDYLEEFEQRGLAGAGEISNPLDHHVVYTKLQGYVHCVGHAVPEGPGVVVADAEDGEQVVFYPLFPLILAREDVRRDSGEHLSGIFYKCCPRWLLFFLFLPYLYHSISKIDVAILGLHGLHSDFD